MLDSSMNMNEYGVPIKRQRISPPLSERVMLYVRQDNEDVYTALHVVPPTTNGLISAVSWHFIFGFKIFFEFNLRLEFTVELQSQIFLVMYLTPNTKDLHIIVKYFLVCRAIPFWIVSCCSGDASFALSCSQIF